MTLFTFNLPKTKKTRLQYPFPTNGSVKLMNPKKGSEAT